jgi:hypothetical protein
VRAVETGETDSFSQLARVMGVSRAWVSMLVELTFLAPDIQEQLPRMPSNEALGMNDLLHIARLSEWEQQRQQWACRRRSLLDANPATLASSSSSSF